MAEKKKIVWVDIYVENVPEEVYPGAGEMWPIMNKYLQRIAREDTELTVSYLKRSSFYVASSYAEMLNNIEIVDAVIEAEKAGADAVIIGCAGDPALRQAREVVDIPVIGLLESSMHLAATLGHRFAIVPPWKSLMPQVQELVKHYSLQDLAISGAGRGFQLDGENFAEQLTCPGKRVIPDFEVAARECIEAGAEVIIPACAYMGPGMIMAGYTRVADTDVPILDITSVGVKMAEMMAELRGLTGLSTSKQGFYRLPISRDLLDRCRAPFFPGSMSVD